MHSYVLRIYRSAGTAAEELSGFLYDIVTGKTLAFSSVEQLCEHLQPDHRRPGRDRTSLRITAAAERKRR